MAEHTGDELERRISESLGRAADDAPGTAGLADGARARLRRRRRTTTAVVAAALVVVAVPVGLRVASSGGGGEDATVATDPAGSPSGSAPAWRTESWRDATVQVPADWGHGSLGAWCAGSAARPEPVVQRPDTVAPMISCDDPANGLGVQFVDARTIMLTSNEEQPAALTPETGAGVDYPEGAWSGFKVVGGTMVQVVAPDEATATRIFDSIALLDGKDANGCPPTLGDAEAADGDGEDSVSLCRYSDADELASSRRLGAEDGAALRAAIEDAPEADSDCSDKPFGQVTDTVVVLWRDAYVGTVGGREFECPVNGVFLVDGARELTDEVRELTRMP